MDPNQRTWQEPGVGTVAADSGAAEVEADIYVASQWQLIWWKFRAHKLALYSGILLVLVYVVAVFVEPLAPSLPGTYNSQYTYAPPQRVHLFHEGRWVGPYAFGLTQEIEQEALRRVFTVDRETIIPLGFLCGVMCTRCGGPSSGMCTCSGPRMPSRLFTWRAQIASGVTFSLA